MIGAEVLPKRWMQITLLLAGIYNICWGTWVVTFPHQMFEFSGMAQPLYPWLWQTIGMSIAVFGVAYLLIYKNPIHFWPVVAIGLLGRILGPIGFLYSAVIEKNIAWKFGVTIITNDLIWLVPFSLILWEAYKHGQR